MLVVPTKWPAKVGYGAAFIPFIPPVGPAAYSSRCRIYTVSLKYGRFASRNLRLNKQQNAGIPDLPGSFSHICRPGLSVTRKILKPVFSKTSWLPLVVLHCHSNDLWLWELYYSRCQSRLYILLYTVCVTAGYLLSYFNRPLFPEWCGHGSWEDDTMVRIGGSYLGFAQTFKAVADHYGWTHIVVLSDDDTTDFCWYGSKAFDEVFANNENYTFVWLRIGSDPSDEQLDDILEEIRSRTRGIYGHFCISQDRDQPPSWILSNRT